VPQARVVGRRRAAAAAIAAGEQISGARRRRRWSQKRLASMVGISQARESQIERGRGVASPEVYFALSEALGIPFHYEFGHDRLDELADAGHLQMQELVLRLSRPAG
jgi:transcriptional regulator with XRE-family HTH domain